MSPGTHCQCRTPLAGRGPLRFHPPGADRMPLREQPKTIRSLGKSQRSRARDAAVTGAQCYADPRAERDMAKPSGLLAQGGERTVTAAGRRHLQLAARRDGAAALLAAVAARRVRSSGGCQHPSPAAPGCPHRLGPAVRGLCYGLGCCQPGQGTACS